MYSPFSASPSPSNPQHYRTQQLNGPENLTSNAAGLTMPSYNSLTVSSSVSLFIVLFSEFTVLGIYCSCILLFLDFTVSVSFEVLRIIRIYSCA